MPNNDPRLWAANQIRKHLARHTERVPCSLLRRVRDLLERQNQVNLIWERIGKAQQRGWHLAARRLQQEFFPAVRSVQNECVEVLHHEPQQAQTDLGIPTQGFLIEELGMLTRELDEVEIRPDKGLIVARTEPIELEGLPLGPFAIELHVGRLAENLNSSCFDCVALEPKAASSNDEVTHPHVQSNQLCAGEASVPIAQALRQGRLADAFNLVRAVLTTYNEHSPYVAIADWDGTRCHDCDCLSNRDSLHFCEHCENDVCDDCTSGCDICDGTCCRSCLERDGESGRYCCPNCRSTCRKCGRTVDSDSFVAESELCPQCAKEEQPEPTNEENDYEESANIPAKRGAAAVAAEP